MSRKEIGQLFEDSCYNLYFLIDLLIIKSEGSDAPLPIVETPVLESPGTLTPVIEVQTESPAVETTTSSDQDLQTEINLIQEVPSVAVQEDPAVQEVVIAPIQENLALQEVPLVEV